MISSMKYSDDLLQRETVSGHVMSFAAAFSDIVIFSVPILPWETHTAETRNEQADQ